MPYDSFPTKVNTMKIVAIIAARNEQRFIEGCLLHLFAQGIDVYLIDTGSTDDTYEIARRHLGSGLVGIESASSSRHFNLRDILRRKEELASMLDADWFMHHDADEVRVTPEGRCTLADSLMAADTGGYTAVNFLEFTFVPVRESPDHDHPRFRETMQWYYPFLPRFPHRLNAWKRQVTRVDLAHSAGHRVSFPGIRMAPDSLHLKHYLFLSVDHALEKYTRRSYDPALVAQGWHGWRPFLQREMIHLPSSGSLRRQIVGMPLDASNPRSQHIIDRDE